MVEVVWVGGGVGAILAATNTDHSWSLSIPIFNFYLNLFWFHVEAAIKESSWELQQGNFNNLLIS